MRKGIFLAATIVACQFLGVGSALAQSCARPGSAQANTQLARRFYAAINLHSKNALDNVLAKDWIDVPLAPGQGPGLAGMKTAMDG